MKTTTESDAATPGLPGNPQRRTELYGILTTTSATFLTSFAGSSSNIALPRIAADFGLDAVNLGWIALSYMLATAALVLPMGRLGDLYGRHRIFITGVVIFAVGSLACAFAANIGQLIAFRVIQGAGASMQFATGMAITTSIFPIKRRGMALGINTASVYFGLSVGPTFGGWLTHAFGWPAVFFACIPPALLVLVISGFLLKGEWKDAEGETFDLPGTIVYGAALVALLLGLTWITRPTGPVLVAGSVGLFVLLGFIENRTPYPVVNLRIFRGNRTFTFSNVAALINYSATFGTGFLLSLYLQNIKEFTPQHAGTILLTQPIIQAVLSPVAGRLSDRVEPTVLASAGMLVTTAGLAAMSFHGPDTPIWFTVGSLALLGCGFALFSSPNTNAVMRSLERRDFGIGSATLSTMRIIGQIMSLGIATVLFAVILGDVEISGEVAPQFLSSMHIAFRIFAALCLTGVFFSLNRGKVLTGQRDPSQSA